MSISSINVRRLLLPEPPEVPLPVVPFLLPSGLSGRFSKRVLRPARDLLLVDPPPPSTNTSSPPTVRASSCPCCDDPPTGTRTLAFSGVAFSGVAFSGSGVTLCGVDRAGLMTMGVKT